MSNLLPKDGLVFINPKKSDQSIIFNWHSWAEIVKANMVKYAHKSYEEAHQILVDDPIFQTAADSYGDVLFTAHEYEYHWAMLIIHGERYWSRKGIDSTPPKDYFEWERKYRKDHNLAELNFIFEGDGEILL